jgi:two-component system cell cycle sensor histidine kinase/response regulator CckA
MQNNRSSRMKPDTINNDPAFPVMAMDILSNVLSRADNPGDLGTYLTEEIRDLTGARCVLLTQCLSTATATAHRVVGVNPLRRREWAESLAVNSMCEVVHRMPAAQFWRGEEPSEVAGLLRREGFKLSMAFPLNAGAFRVGAMLVLGLPDEEHISSVLDLLNDLSAIVALVLRNSFLFERQEQIIQERTAELSASEEKYRTLIESANDAVFIHEIMEDGIPGPFIEVNELACRRLGYSREELARMSPIELDDPCYRDRITLAMQRLLKDGHAVFETAQIAKDGRSIPVEVSTRVLELKGKRLLFSIVRDITERKRMEEELRLAHDGLEKRVVERTEQLQKTAEELRTSEERYALAVRGSNEGIWDVNLISGEAYFSPRWKSILGYEDDEIPNDVEEWKKRIHPDDRHLVMESRKACLDGHIPAYEIEYRLQHKDGSFRWIHSRGACLRDLEGKAIRFAGSNSDITDRKRIEDILHESEKKYRTLFEESKDTIFISDPARRMIDVNQAGTELFGYTKGELFSLELEKLYCNPQDREALWQKLYQSGFVSDFEVEMKRRDGEKIIVHLSMSVIKDASGQIAGYQGIIRDVTERKRLERQLLQSQKMESVGILAGGVAHDFNNLLTAISGYGQILMETIPEDDEQSQESVTSILNAAGRAGELTRGLLAFSRKQVISPKTINVDSLISDTSKLIQRIIGEDIELSTNFTAKKLLVKADPGQVEQVLMNLATNARDAMPNGGHLSITISQVVLEEGSETQYDLSQPGKYALISVADTGTGIDKKTLESIFEPFYTTKEVGKGTGLGLAIVHGIIKQHNGSVLASSEAGKGTRFDIYLPLVEGHTDNEESKITAPLVGGVETLLVVEDEETVRMFMKKILERAGYKVIIADNGEDAMAKFSEHDDISLVLSDVVMPRRNGREMLDEMKKIKPGVKAVFISGYAADMMKNRGMFEEAAEFITKPFKKNDLLQKIREVLGKD